MTGRCYARHRHEEFLRFLQRLARVYPAQELHLVVDNYRTHKHPVVRAWLADNPRIHLRFTPIGGSWMNQVETWFSILQPRAIARGVFRSVPALIAAIGRFLTGWNKTPGRSLGSTRRRYRPKANRLRIPNWCTRFNQDARRPWQRTRHTARRLINSGAPSQGFEVCREHHRHADLSVEAIAILPDYAEKLVHF